MSAVTGTGALTKSGDGTLILTQDSQYTDGTTIARGNLQLGTGGNTGSITGNIVDNGVLQIKRANTLNLNGAISGTGQLWQQGSGTTVLSGANRYSGLTLVESGTLLAQGANRLSAASGHVVSKNALLDTGGTNQTVAGLINQGTVNLRGGDIGSTLMVKVGNYVGLNGVLKIAAQQHSPGIADKLVIDGGKATGVTLLDIDVSQLGEQTTGDGIQVVQTLNGATTTVHTTKDAFTLGADHLEAGAFEYRLFAGNQKGSGEDWFLRTEYRPKVSLFDTIASTARQTDLAVLGTLHQRVGDEQSGVSVTDEHNNRFWMRYIGQTADQSFNDATDSHASTHINGMQVGADLYSDEHWHAGVYTAIVDVDSSISGLNSGTYGSAGYNSTLSSYFAVYATWTADNGFYVDNVLQYGHHSTDLKNTINQETYSPNGNSYLASVEVGKPFYFGQTSWALEPQAQLIYQHSDFNGATLPGDARTRVSVDADDALIGRLGVRLTTETQTRVGKIKPYVRVNLWQALNNGSDTASFRNITNNAGQTVLNADQRYSSTEVAAGAT